MIRPTGERCGRNLFFTERDTNVNHIDSLFALTGTEPRQEQWSGHEQSVKIIPGPFPCSGEM